MSGLKVKSKCEEIGFALKVFKIAPDVEKRYLVFFINNSELMVVPLTI